MEGSAQRCLQAGVAKKIKNGARKIVLDKAEEARAAAFSAFKSLGFNVPQFAPPMLSTAACDSKQGAGGTSSGSDKADTDHSFVDADHMESTDRGPIEKEREDMTKSSDNVVLAEGKSSSAMPCSLLTEKSLTPIEDSLTMRGRLNATFDTTKNTVLTTYSDKLLKPNDKTGLRDGCLSHGIEEQHLRETVAIGSMGSPFQRGPINAVSCPGGFDSFLDLWNTTPEFYFDIHYNKRMELNSAAPFEIHGIAICWENSPVYYINLPKDLLLSDNRKDDCISLSACGNKHKVSFSKNDLEISRHRWSRINKIMGKRDARKFSWNLKIQIQVLKRPAVSIQRFGCLDCFGNNMTLEVVDNSYILLSPIHVKDAIDMCIVAWILWPDEERSSHPNLERVIQNTIFFFCTCSCTHVHMSIGHCIIL